MFKTILVPTDGSEHARKSVMLAADLAQKYGAKLILLHVVTPSWDKSLSEELRSYARAEHIQADERSILESLGQQILRAGETLAREKGADRLETQQEVGDPAEAILDVANSRQADLIVMGSRGLGNLQGLLQGSVSHKVSAHSPCSCVTVK